MSDKFKTTFPINIDFTKGEQPTDTKLTALARWARNGMRSFEELIGDLRGGDSNIPWNSTGNARVSIKSNKRAKSDGSVALADDYHVYNQIVSLARLIGPAGLLNPQVEGGAFSPKEAQGAGYPLEPGVCVQVLPFKPADNTDIDPGDFTGVGAPSIKVNSPEEVLWSQHYHVTSEGILYTGSPVNPGVSLRYSYTTGIGDSYLRARANVIPGPGSYDLQPASGPGWMCKVRYYQDTNQWILIAPAQRTGQEALFNSGIQLSDFEASHNPIHEIPNLSEFAPNSSITDNYYLLWDHETSNPLYNVKFKKTTGAAGLSEIYVIELVGPSSLFDSWLADDGVSLLKDNPWSAGNPGLESTRRFSLLAPGTQITTLLSQLRLEMKTHSHDGNGSEPIDHKYIVGGLTEHTSSRRNGFIFSSIRGNVHPQYLHRHGFRGGGSLHRGSSGPTGDGYLQEEEDVNASNAFMGDMVIGPANSSTSNPKFAPADPETNYNWSVPFVNKANPISHRLIFGWASLNKDASGGVSFTSIREKLDYRDIRPTNSLSIFDLYNSEVFGILVDETQLQGSKGLLFENSNVFFGNGNYLDKFKFQRDNEDEDERRLSLFSQRWRNFLHSMSKGGFSGIGAGLAGVFSVAYSGELDGSFGLNDYNNYLTLPGVDWSPRLVEEDVAPYRKALFSTESGNRPKFGGFNYLYAGGVLGTHKVLGGAGPGTNFDKGRLLNVDNNDLMSHPLLAGPERTANNWYGSNVFVSSYGDKHIIRRFSFDILDNFDTNVGYLPSGQVAAGLNLRNQAQLNTSTLFPEHEHWGPLRRIANKQTGTESTFEIGGNHRFMYKVKSNFERFGLLGQVSLSGSEKHHGHLGSWNTSRMELERPSPEDMGSKLNGLNTIEVFNGISYSPEADYHSEFVLKSTLTPQWNFGPLKASTENSFPATDYNINMDGSRNYPNENGIEFINKFLYNEDATQQERGGISKKHYAFGFNVQNGGFSNLQNIYNFGPIPSYTGLDEDPTFLKKRVLEPSDQSFLDNLLFHNFEDPYSNFRSNFVSSENKTGIEIKPALWIDQVLRTFAYENNIDFNREPERLYDLIDSFEVYLVPKFTSEYYEMGAIKAWGIKWLDPVYANGMHIPVQANIVFQPVQNKIRVANNSQINEVNLVDDQFYNDLINYDNSFRTTSLLRSENSTGKLFLAGIEWKFPFVEIDHYYIGDGQVPPGSPPSEPGSKQTIYFKYNSLEEDKSELQNDPMLHEAVWNPAWSLYMGSSLRSPDLLTELLRRRFILEDLGIPETELTFDFKVNLKIKSRYRLPRRTVDFPQ